MGSLECFVKCQSRPALGRGLDIQEFQHWKFAVKGRGEPLQCGDGHQNADTAHTIAVLQCEYQTIFVCRGDVTIFVYVIDNEWKRG